MTRVVLTMARFTGEALLSAVLVYGIGRALGLGV